MMKCRFFFSSRRRHTRWNCDWSSDVCSSDLPHAANEDCSHSGDTTLCASSVLPATQGNIYGPRNLTDGNDKTAWVEGSDGQGLGEFVVLEFDSARAVRGLAIRNGYDKSPDIFT